MCGPSSAHQRNAIDVAFCWRADDSPRSNAGLLALLSFRGSGRALLRNPILIDISGGGPDPQPPSGSVHGS